MLPKAKQSKAKQGKASSNAEEAYDNELIAQIYIISSVLSRNINNMLR
jgi:hypothetical protein